MYVIACIITVAIVNWIVGLVFTLVGAPLVLPFLARAQKDDAPEGAARAYFRAIATSHLLNHSATTIAVLLVCSSYAAYNRPVWLAWTVFWIFFLTMRLPHMFDAATRFIKADQMSIASNG